MHVLHANELEYLDLLVRWNRWTCICVVGKTVRPICAASNIWCVYICMHASLLNQSPQSTPTTNPTTKYKVHNTQLFSVRTALAQQEQEADHQGGFGRLASALFGGSASALTELFRLPPLLVTVQAFTMNLKGEDCSQWLARLLAAPVRSSMAPSAAAADEGGEEVEEGRDEAMRAQQMGLGTLFPSVGCQTLFLPATSREQLHNLAGGWVGVLGGWIDG